MTDRGPIWLVVALVLSLILMARDARADKIKPTRNDLKFTVEVIFLSHQDAFDFCKTHGMWPELNALPSNTAMGCSLFYREQKRCVIVTPKPTHVDDSETQNLGHEAAHCIFGRYHE